MKKLIPVLWLLLTLAGVICTAVCMIQFIMSVRYGELGRVLVYLVLTVWSAGLVAMGLSRLVRLRKSKEMQPES